jgi:hypothetical protein
VGRPLIDLTANSFPLEGSRLSLVMSESCWRPSLEDFQNQEHPAWLISSRISIIAKVKRCGHGVRQRMGAKCIAWRLLQKEPALAGWPRDGRGSRFGLPTAGDCSALASSSTDAAMHRPRNAPAVQSCRLRPGTVGLTMENAIPPSDEARPRQDREAIRG